MQNFTWDDLLRQVQDALPDRAITYGRTVVVDCPQKIILCDGKKTNVRADLFELEDCKTEHDLRTYASKLSQKIGEFLARNAVPS